MPRQISDRSHEGYNKLADNTIQGLRNLLRTMKTKQKTLASTRDLSDSIKWEIIGAGGGKIYLERQCAKPKKRKFLIQACQKDYKNTY